MRAAWWWIDRWRKSTAYTDMTLAEQGAYRNLLDELWLRDGVLPNDERILGKIAGSSDEWRKVRRNVLSRFVLTSEGWRNETHDAIQAASRRNALKQQRYRDRLNAQAVIASTNGNGNVTGNETGPPSPYLRDLGTQQDLVLVEHMDQKRTRAKNARVARPTEPADPRVKEFLAWFPAEYKRRRHGADYLVKWPRDAPLVKQMLHATSLDRLKLLAQAMLSDKCAEEFIVTTDRGIGILSMKFNWLSDRVAEWETEQQAVTR